MEAFTDRLEYLGDMLERASPDLVRDHSVMREEQYMTCVTVEHFISVLGAFSKTHSAREVRSIIRPINAANANILAQFSVELENPSYRGAAMGGISEEIAADITARPINQKALEEATRMAITAGFTQRQILAMMEGALM